MEFTIKIEQNFDYLNAANKLCVYQFNIPEYQDTIQHNGVVIDCKKLSKLIGDENRYILIKRNSYSFYSDVLPRTEIPAKIVYGFFTFIQ